MAFIVIRTIPRKTQSAHNAGEGPTGIRSNHVGDIIAAYPDTHMFSGNERREFGILKVVGMPVKARRRIMKGTEVIVGYETEVDAEGVEVPTGIPIMETVRPRRLRISKSALEGAHPALVTRIRRAYNRSFTVDQENIPVVQWDALKSLWRDKEQGEALIQIDDTDEV